MIRLSITTEAYCAIAQTIVETMELREPQRLEDGRYWIWLPTGVAHALARLRRPGEDYSETIIRIARAQL